MGELKEGIGKGGRVFRNMYKGTWTKPSTVGSRVGSGVGWGGGKWRQLFLNNNFKNEKKEEGIGEINGNRSLELGW